MITLQQKRLPSPLRCGQLRIWNGFCLPYGGSKDMKSRVALEIEAQQGEWRRFLPIRTASRDGWKRSIASNQSAARRASRAPSTGRCRLAGRCHVLKRALPGELQLSLDAAGVSIGDGYLREDIRSRQS
jgi:hypothetical protein